MAEYTPETTAVRNAYVRNMRNAFVASTSELRDEFDRWLSTVQHEAWLSTYWAEVTSRAENPFAAYPLRVLEEAVEECECCSEIRVESGRRYLTLERIRNVLTDSSLRPGEKTAQCRALLTELDESEKKANDCN